MSSLHIIYHRINSQIIVPTIILHTFINCLGRRGGRVSYSLGRPYTECEILLTRDIRSGRPINLSEKRKLHNKVVTVVQYARTLLSQQCTSCAHVYFYTIYCDDVAEACIILGLYGT